MKLKTQGVNTTHDLYVKSDDIVVLDNNMIIICRDSYNWTFVLTDESRDEVANMIEKTDWYCKNYNEVDE